MRETLILTRRELKAYFDSPTAYVVLSIFLLITGWFFSTNLFLQDRATLRTLFDLAPMVFLFFIPAITMGTFAEERRSGTIELLFSLPVRDWQVIAGKTLAPLILTGVALAFTFFHALTVSLLGDLDFGATVGGYLGLSLFALAAVSIGLFASSLTRNQIVAFIIAFTVIFVLYMLDKVTVFVPGFLAGILEYLSLDYHYQNLLRGVIDTRDVLYYLSVTVFFGMLTAFNLAKRPE